MNGCCKVCTVVICIQLNTDALQIVADVPDAETQYHAHEFLDVAVQPKPIYITRNEVYSTHRLLSQHLEHLVSVTRQARCISCSLTCLQAPRRDDPLRTIIMELGGVPNLLNDELGEKNEKPVTLELTNRFANVKGSNDC